MRSLWTLSLLVIACTSPAPEPKCGNGVVEVGEACDDGNAVETDACSTACVAARCGDLALDVKREKARVVALALRAAAEAVRDAGGLEAHAPARRGASIASGVGGLGDIVDAAHRVAEGKKLSPFFVPRALCNTAAGAVSLQHSCAGPVQTSAAACAAGAQSVGDAFRLVQRGDCDVALCGGAEACVDEVALRGFARMGALSRDGAARPFDAAPAAPHPRVSRTQLRAHSARRIPAHSARRIPNPAARPLRPRAPRTQCC